MAAPQAYFVFSNSGNSFVFTSLSLNNPSSFAWDFGDGNNSTDEGPTHSYADNGFFKVGLTVTNADGSDTFEQEIQLQNGTVGFRPIFFMVTDVLPADTGIPDATISEFIRKNQLYLSSAASTWGIEEGDTYNETAYSPLANMLVAKMTVVDVLTRGGNQYLASLSGGSSESNGTQVKSITTGPTEVEWFEGSELWSDIMKDGGLFQSAQMDACNIASRLYVQLPYCPNIPNPVIAMTILPGDGVSVNPDNQFTR